MPIFEYQCKKCNEVFELLIRSSKDKLVCPKCGAKNPKKLISSFTAKDSESVKDCPGGGKCSENHSAGHCCGGACGCAHHH